jgi:hypothetical protein
MAQFTQLHFGLTSDHAGVRGVEVAVRAAAAAAAASTQDRGAGLQDGSERLQLRILRLHQGEWPSAPSSLPSCSWHFLLSIPRSFSPFLAAHTSWEDRKTWPREGR